MKGNNRETENLPEEKNAGIKLRKVIIESTTEGEGNTKLRIEEKMQAKKGRVQAIAKIFGETEGDKKKKEAEGRMREKKQREKIERGKEVMKKRGIYEGPQRNQELPPEREPKNETIKSKKIKPKK